MKKVLKNIKKSEINDETSIKCGSTIKIDTSNFNFVNKVLEEVRTAYNKLDNTLCLNTFETERERRIDEKGNTVIVKNRILFNLDEDEHIDCKDMDEMIHSLEVLKKFIESVFMIKDLNEGDE